MAAVVTSNVNRSWSDAAYDFQKAYSKGIKDPGLIGNLFKAMDLSAFGLRSTTRMRLVRCPILHFWVSMESW